jgi:nicotinate-nucleotide pyrophosphorylase
VELSAKEIRQAVQAALAEDIGSGDATTLPLCRSGDGPGRHARARTARRRRTRLRGSRLSRTFVRIENRKARPTVNA